ncbi:MAG: dipeptide ABC transporter ATP-binding protein [bacterium]
MLNIRDLSVGFTSRSGRVLPILRQVNLAVEVGESIGIVGESGSGKSTLALAAMGYLKHGLQVMHGAAIFPDRDLFTLPPSELQAIRGRRLALIPQNSGQSLTPTLRVGAQLAEALKLHSSLPRGEHPAKVVDLLEKVRLPAPASIAKRYPHELSGGQQQRVAIAMALAGEPEALLLDEPTTGLDVTTQAHILELLRDLATQYRTSMIYVSHDLGAIARVCERVVVMYAGEIVLSGSARQVLRDPSHPYARGLLASIPRLASSRLPASLRGIPPLPGAVGDGCAFAERCVLAEDRCRRDHPGLSEVADGQRTRCHFSARAGEIEIGGDGRSGDDSSGHHSRKDAGNPVAMNGNRQSGVAAKRKRDSRLKTAGMTATESTTTTTTTTALTLNQVSISYAKPSVVEQLLGRRSASAPTVSDISLAVRKGETLALVGESGSGKSTILKAIAGLLPTRGGDIRLGDEALAGEVEQRSGDQLRRVQLVFQNPDESLNARQTVAEILAQPLKLYFNLDAKQRYSPSCRILETVRLGPQYLDRLPSQLSGGEKQRVAIARAFVAQPEIVLCDEVTSALDVSVQAAVLGLLDALRKQQGTTYLFVSHDLAVVRALADRVAVLYQGRLCEIGATAQVYARPSHPYTEALLRAVLDPDPDSAPRLTANDVIESSPPPTGCPFQRRCARRIGDLCDHETPPWRVADNGHSIRCHLSLHDLANGASVQ